MPLFSNRHAFVIAVQEYQYGIRSLATPLADADFIAAVLRDNFGFEIHTCAHNPTQAELIAFLESIPMKVGDVDETDTQVFIYFAGHGVALDSSTGVKGYLLPSDARQTTNGQNTLVDTSVSMDFLVEAIQAFKAQQVLLVLDCCFAGLIRWASLSTHRGLEIGEDEELYRQQFYFNTRHKVRQVLTSSSHDQRAIDLLGIRDETNQNSPFVRLLGQALNGEADSNHDGVLMLEEIQTYVNGRLAVIAQQRNNEQITGFYPLADHDCGSFLFFAKDFDPGTLDPKFITNPFKGLQAYDVQDRAIYTGRQTVIEAITILVKKRSSTNGGIIVVSGISGSGKSSVVRAGVIPRLPNFTSIPIVVPGRNPLEVLAEIERSSTSIIVLDQLEQIITQATDSSKSAVDTFIQKLVGLNKTVICTIRTDFEVQVFKDKDLSQEPFSLYRMPRLEQENIRDIILKPAMRVGRFFYPESLVGTIVNDFQNYPNSLSLLSLVLYELFEQCKLDVYHEITLNDYRGIGGLTGVLYRKLETLYNEFSNSDEHSMLQNILLRITSVKGGKLTARRIYWRELVFEEPSKQTLCEQIVEALISDKYRLIVVHKENYIEPSHDVVVQSWGTQSEWIAEISSGRLGLREALSTAIEDYNHHKADTNYLWNNDPNLLLLGDRPKVFWPQLHWDWQSFKQTFYQQREWFTKPEEEFVRKSFNKRKVARAGIRLLMTAIVLTLIGISYFFHQLMIEQQKTKAALLTSEARDLYISEPSQAIRLLKYAYEFDPENFRSSQEAASMYDSSGVNFEKTIFLHNQPISKLLFSPNGQYIAIVLNNNTVTIWNSDGNFLTNLSKHTEKIQDIIFSPNSKFIITTSVDHTAKLWDLKGELLADMNKGTKKKNIVIFSEKGYNDLHVEVSDDITFSPDGNYILTNFFKETPKLWNIKGELVKDFNKYHSNNAFFSPDGKQIVINSGNQSIRIWSINGTPINELIVSKFPDEIDEYTSMSPNGKYIVSNNIKSVKLWKINGTLVNTLKSGTNEIDEIIFSPLSDYILTSYDNSTVKLWNIRGELIKTFNMHSINDNTINSIAFSPNGQYILLASEKKTNVLNTNGELIYSYNSSNFAISRSIFSPNSQYVLINYDNKLSKIWNLKGELLLSVSDLNNSAIFSPDNKSVLVISNELIAKLWILEKKLMLVLKNNKNDPDTDKLSHAIFSPNNKYILTVLNDLTSKLWNIKGDFLANLSKYTKKAIFSPNGKLILTVSEDNTAKIWNLKGQQLQNLDKHTDNINNAKFSPNGQYIVTSSDDKTAKIWDLNGEVIADLNKHLEAVKDANFSPDGKFVLTHSRDSSAKLWNLRGDLIVNINKFDSYIYKSIFSPNGKYILAAFNKTVKVWDLKGTLLATLNKHTSLIDNALFSPDSQYILTTSRDKTVKLWSLNGNIIAEFADSSTGYQDAIFSPNGNYILTSEKYDDKQLKVASVKLWSLKGELLASLTKHTSYIIDAIFSPDSQYIITGSYDNTVKLWNLKGELLADFNKNSDYINSVTVSSDGEHILATFNNEAKVWYTPQTIFKWLSTAPIAPLRNDIKILYSLD